MSRHAHLDLVGGIAGDMFAAAMLDALPELTEPLMADLVAAGIAHHVRFEQQRTSVNGIGANRVSIVLKEGVADSVTRYRAIRKMLATSGLERNVGHQALALFEILAEAESTVHDLEKDDVHFHEVSDWDSLADIVMAASLIARSGIDSWTCGPVPLGSGCVRSAHGLLPVPAPATTLLLTGFQVHDDGEDGERVTPTGAAILRHLAAGSPAPNPRGVLAKNGIGAGTRRFSSLPNILRVLIFDQDEGVANHTLRDRIGIVSFEVDDMTPEELAVAVEHIRAGDGVRDVSYQLRYGKKGRVQFSVQVLTDPDAVETIARLCFMETSTLGLRVDVSARHLLRRAAGELDTGDGGFRSKHALRPDGSVTAKIEADDLARVKGHHRRRRLVARAEAQNE